MTILICLFCDTTSGQVFTKTFIPAFKKTDIKLPITFDIVFVCIVETKK